MHIGMVKPKFLELLDKAVYDESKYKTLLEIVNQAINNW
jgi:hypothetical protein